MKRYALAFLGAGCILLIPRSSYPAELPSAKPSDVAMSQDVLEAGVKLYEDAVAKDDLRGVVLLVARRGKVVLHRAIGWRNKEKKLSMQKDTLFRMASNTKPVVATGILMLGEQNKIGLDHNVRRYIPAWDNYRSGRIKVRHLLNHTSGLRMGGVFIKPLVPKSKSYPDAPSLRAEVDRVGRIGAREFPGKTWSYNNAGYNTLGRLIEIASKQKLKDFLRERIYVPLGMKDSWNYEADAPAERMARVYRRNKGKWTIRWSPGDGPDWPFVRSSGGMISSANDYAVFCQMYLNGGDCTGKRLLKQETVKTATAIQTESAYSEKELMLRTRFYGYGWFVNRDGIYSHGGSDGTFAWIDPRHEMIGLVFTQSPGGRNPRRQFMKVVEAGCFDVK